jgi:hypothetical protein
MQSQNYLGAMQYIIYNDDSCASSRSALEIYLYSDDLPPPYRDHKLAPRCEEDVWRPAPSYASLMQMRSPDGADKMVEWIVSWAGRVFRQTE